ncbi:MAG: hypothetical protein CSA11_02205 [Chloroflexi bacterium]|nr:MAG: hypothetical protein CSB13_02160 [Chloroflexota bacterium]PIE81949.1 MAG: hypothetical protein CSA11_02205 [Chloroflexota bacterium]
MSKIGRNDPCYCGSGKKYKQCHMKEDKAAEKERRSWTQAATWLRRDLMKYARDERFNESFALAVPLFWNDYYDMDNVEQMSVPEAMRFTDWFAFDYQMENGRYLIEIYREEKQDDLSEYQQAVLDSWIDADPASAYELTGYKDQTLSLKEITSGEEYEVFEASGHGNVNIGEIILARILPVHDQLEFSSSPAYLPSDEIQDLPDKLKAAEATYLEEHPDATHQDFMRAKSYLLVHHALEQAERVGRPPVARLDENREDGKTQKLASRMKQKVQKQIVKDIPIRQTTRQKIGE